MIDFNPQQLKSLDILIFQRSQVWGAQCEGGVWAITTELKLESKDRGGQ